MWEWLRQLEHRRVDWVFDHPWIAAIPFMLYVGFYGYLWVEHTLHGRKWFR